MDNNNNDSKADKERGLHFLYETVPGRILLKLLSSVPVSRLSGHLLDSTLSKILIPHFISSNNINTDDYEQEQYNCFNDFFTRRIRPELRPIDSDPLALIAPCDGLLSVYDITPEPGGTVIPVKQSRYTIADLLDDAELFKRYEGGLCLIFRLCVSHYHRYCYIDNGYKSQDVYIPGCLHTVRPVALRQIPVFVRNSRSYTEIETENFGGIVQMEVGAMLVGKIENNLAGAGNVVRGQEKGRFMYGGSTVIVLLEPGKADIYPEFAANTANETETEVRMGQRIGQRTKRTTG